MLDFSKKCFFGETLVSDWKKGSSWHSLGQSGSCDVEGTVIEALAPRRLVVTWQATFALRGPSSLELFLRATGFVNSDHGRSALRPQSDHLQLIVTCNARTLNEARGEVHRSAEQFAGLMALKTGISFDLVFGGLESVSEGPTPSALAGLLIQWDEVPDLADSVASDARDSAELTDVMAHRETEPTTLLFDKSLDYFDRALFFRRQVLKLADPLRRRGAHVAIEVILNFYKAVAIRFGDPIDNNVAQSLALSREDKRRVEHNLYDLRHRHDVAHETAQYVHIEDRMPAAWKITKNVLTQYGAAIRAGKRVQPPRESLGT